MAYFIVLRPSKSDLAKFVIDISQRQKNLKKSKLCDSMTPEHCLIYKYCGFKPCQHTNRQTALVVFTMRVALLTVIAKEKEKLMSGLGILVL